MHAALVSRLDLRLRRRSLLGYTAGMALYALIIVALYPQFKNSVSLDQITKNGNAVAALLGATGTLTSPAGWLDANIYANFLPLIMLLITVGYGASCIAGQDEDGTLSLTTALPIPRRAILLQKALTLAVQAALLGLATTICVVIGRGFGLTIPVAGIAGITIGVTLLGVDFGLLALAVGASDRPPRHRTWHHRIHSRGLLSGQLARPRGRLDPARPIRLALLLVGRQRPAHHRTHRDLIRHPGRHRHRAAGCRRSRVQSPGPALTGPCQHPACSSSSARQTTPACRLLTVPMDRHTDEPDLRATTSPAPSSRQRP